MGFDLDAFNGTLLIASDGFCNYANRDKVMRSLPFMTLAETPRKLIELVRLKSGELWDDVAIVACRRQHVARPRVRHEL